MFSLKKHTINLFSILMVTCPQTEMINKTKIAWNEYDYYEFHYAEKRCTEIYNDSPCLKYFAKVGERDYVAICGK